jgi:hypothetical protein
MRPLHCMGPFSIVNALRMVPSHGGLVVRPSYLKTALHLFNILSLVMMMMIILEPLDWVCTIGTLDFQGRVDARDITRYIARGLARRGNIIWTWDAACYLYVCREVNEWLNTHYIYTYIYDAQSSFQSIGGQSGFVYFACRWKSAIQTRTCTREGLYRVFARQFKSIPSKIHD